MQKKAGAQEVIDARQHPKWEMCTMKHAVFCDFGKHPGWVRLTDTQNFGTAILEQRVLDGKPRIFLPPLVEAAVVDRWGL